jgi:hypothetical protein
MILSRDWVTRDGVSIGNRFYWTFTYDSLTELHTPKITVITAQRRSSQSLIAVAWQRFPKTDVALPLGPRAATGLIYQILTSHNCNSQLTQPTTQVKVKVMFQSASLIVVSSTHLGPKTWRLLLSDSYGFVDVGHPSRRQDGSIIYTYCWPELLVLVV